MQEEQVYSRLWRRLGLFEVWDKPMLFFAITFVALLSYAFDAVRLNNYSLSWIPVNAISMAIAVSVVLVGLSIARKRDLDQNQRTWFNLFIAATAMGIKNLLTFLLCGVFGIADSGTLLFRFVGGATIGVSLLLIYSNLRGAKIERLVSQRELLAKEQALRGFRENITDIFATEQQELTERTATELLPRLIELQENVELGQTGANLTKQFENMIKNEVRPLSTNLAREASKLKTSIPAAVDTKPSELEIRVNLAKSIRPISTGLLVFMAWWMLSQIILPQATLMDIALATVFYLGLLFLIQFLVKRFESATVNQALLFAGLPGSLAASPSYVLLYQIPHEPSQQNLLPALLVIGSWASLSFSLAYILDRGRAVAEDRLVRLVGQFSKENKLFEQKLWVSQHVWYTLLHGTVQSALTAAAIRAGGKEKLSKAEQEAILKDLNRAIRALKNPSLAEVKFEKSLKDIEQTWAGICKIHITVEPNLWKRLDESFDARLVTNEVIKEAVSNAIKHGQATQVDITIDLSQDDDIYLTVANNGAALKTNKSSGIGSKIFDSVCLEHSLTPGDTEKRTVFRATIPVG